MSLKVELPPPGPPVGLIADRRLFLTADRETVVEDGDPRAALLFATKDYGIPAAEVERLGLALVGGRVVQGAPAESVSEDPAPVEEKAAAEPSEKPKARGRKKGG